MALLADLGHLHLRLTDPQMGAHRQVFQVDALGVDVLRKHPRIQWDGAARPHGVHALLRQQGDLPVPVPGVGVPHDAVAEL